MYNIANPLATLLPFILVGFFRICVCLVCVSSLVVGVFELKRHNI